MPFRLLPASLAVLLLLPALPLGAREEPAGARPKPPPTRAVDVVDRMHGQAVPDPYRWLEDDEAPDVVAWDAAQDAVLRAHLDGFPRRKELGERLRREFALGSMPSLPTFRGGRVWFTYREPGEDHARLCVTDRAPTEPHRAQVVLDPNRWSEDGTAGLKAWFVSPDGRYVAYRRDQSGSEETTLFVRDVRKGKDLPERFTRTKFAALVWTPDSQGFFYDRSPDPESVPAGEAQYHTRIYYHRLGTLPLDDPIVYGQGSPMLESGYPFLSSDEKHVFIARSMPYQAIDTFELDAVTQRLHPIVVGDGARTYVDRAGEHFLFNTDRNNGMREVFVAPVTASNAPGAWIRVDFPRGPQGVIEDCWFVGEDWLLCHVVEDVVSRLYVRRVDGGPVREIPLPGPGTVGRVARKVGDTRVWFTFQSYDRPRTIHGCDVAHPALSCEPLLEQPTTVDTTALVTTRATYPSKDGTGIPIFFLHREDVKLDGSAPTILTGYGGFRVGIRPSFSRTRAMWAEMGGVLAVACLRGGDEFGEAWHEAGMLGNKQNVFDDFSAGADWLVATGRAARERLAIHGGSNGGLLVAACINQRPDLCAAVVCDVPLTDMLRYHRFQYAKSWTLEYGDPDDPEAFRWLRAYSPYHNVKPAAYPPILVTAGLHDGRVNAFHARKIVARWQRVTTSDHPVLLRLDRQGGHGAANLTRRVESTLDLWCFLLDVLDAGD